MSAGFAQIETTGQFSQRRIETQKLLVLIICHVGKLVETELECFFTQRKKGIMLFDDFEVRSEDFKAAFMLGPVIEAIKLSQRFVIRVQFLSQQT